ncbi:pantoate--beta-alanine ligase [Opitutales bacterium]|uniref:pantoate--beta-alanine ligase n=1 Tax=Candidatus Chordibacter forsetii TaxID=3381758 RepID=UPI00231E6B81|nr:pantoate--beta-alanine ligase [Opitutales bacterium]MDB3957703.1 pantoate--beta-alanine ligase [Opitutales bacterium]MDC0363170.1 pantoate--beta-alanine ligase [Opitutales bacterium]
MQVIRSVKEMKTRSMDLRRHGKTIGFVPTMGFLHEGHLSLVDLIRKDCDILLLSIYVNPTQFGVGEDFDKYPRDTERDLELCRSRGVDLVFIPESSEIYAENASTYVVEEEVGMGMCGNARPNHFRGVATVCAKLFNLCLPNYVALGQKDAQQVVVLKRMIRDLHFPIEVVVGPILREPDGLAMSSRNKYLQPKQREEALLVYQSIQAAQKVVEEKGSSNVDRVKAEVLNVLKQGRLLRVNYVDIVDRGTMRPEKEIAAGRSLLAVAVWVDQVRLIDNFCF